MNLSAKNSPREVKSLKDINLLNLDKNIIHLISGYLTDKDLANFLWDLINCFIWIKESYLLSFVANILKKRNRY